MTEHRLIVQQVDPRYPIPGGIDTCIRGLIRYCPPGIELSLAGVDALGDSPIHEWLPVDIDGVTVPFMPLARLDPSRQDRRVPHSVRLAAGLVRVRHSLRRFDAIQTHRLEIGVVAQRIAPGRRHVQFLHIDGQESLEQGSDSMWRHLPWGYRQMETRFLPRADDVVVFSSAGATRLRRVSDHVRFSPTWFDPALFHPVDRERTSWGRVLWVGRVEPPKDPLLALAVLRELPLDFTLTVVGDGVLRRDLESAARAAGMDDRLSVLGALSKAEVALQLASHDVLLMTSHYEGYPRAVVEALASGLPVVTTPGGEPNGLVVDGETGYHTPGRSPRALADALIQARTLRSAACAASVSHLSAPVVVADVLRPSSPTSAQGSSTIATSGVAATS